MGFSNVSDNFIKVCFQPLTLIIKISTLYVAAIFEVPRIFNEKPGIFIENLRFGSKNPVIQIKKFKTLGFLQIEFTKYLVFRKLGISA